MDGIFFEADKVKGPVPFKDIRLGGYFMMQDFGSWQLCSKTGDATMQYLCMGHKSDDVGASESQAIGVHPENKFYLAKVHL